MGKTELELIKSHQQNLFLIEKQINQGKFSVQELGDLMPDTILQLNNSQNLGLEYFSASGESIFKRDKEEIYTLRTEALLQHLHPLTVAVAFPLVENFYQTAEDTDTTTYFQHIRGLGEKDYQPILTTVKKFKHRNQFIGLTIANLRQMDKAVKKIEYMLEAEEFACKNFEKFNSLSKREREVFILTAEGKKASEIADLLFISKYTVEVHRKKINEKLGINDWKGIIKYALAFDLIDY